MNDLDFFLRVAARAHDVLARDHGLAPEWVKSWLAVILVRLVVQQHQGFALTVDDVTRRTTLLADGLGMADLMPPPAELHEVASSTDEDILDPIRWMRRAEQNASAGRFGNTPLSEAMALAVVNVVHLVIQIDGSAPEDSAWAMDLTERCQDEALAPSVMTTMATIPA